MRRQSHTILIGVFLLSSCQAQEQEPALEREQPQIKASEGYELYQEQNCLSCHGDQLQGASGPSLLENELSAEEIKDIIENGTGFMPPQQMGEEEKAKLAEWLSGY